MLEATIAKKIVRPSGLVYHFYVFFYAQESIIELLFGGGSGSWHWYAVAVCWFVESWDVISLFKFR